MSSTTTTTRLEAAPITSTSAEWALANNRVQDRIIRLQEQRACEATGKTGGISRFGNFLKPLSTSQRQSFRVGQLDTELLDNELLDLLKGQLWGGLKYFRPSFKDTYEPELLLLLRAALFKLTIWDHNASYGAALQNLRYTDARKSGAMEYPPSRGQKSLYGLVTVGGRYLHQRLNLFLLSKSGHDEPVSFTAKLSRLLDVAGSIHSVFTLLSFIAFLVTGQYRTILDRMLRMRLAAPSHAVSREVSFEYLNRQLVWHAFTEFLLFILPHLRIGRWRRWWARIIRKVRSPENGTSGTEAAGELAFLPERTCAICYKETEGESAGAAMSGGRATDVTNPYEAVECGHVYCYVCLAGKIELEEGEGWSCLRCACIVKRCRPWRGGVEGLTGIGDWGEEVYEKSINEQSDGDEDGIHIHQTDLLDELQDGDIESEFGGHHSDDEEEDDDDNSIYHTLNHTNINTTPTYTRRFGDIHSEAGSEETEKPEYQNHLNNNDTDDEDGTATGKNNNLWPIEYADGGSVFDDSQYNTAEDYD